MKKLFVLFCLIFLAVPVVAQSDFSLYTKFTGGNSPEFIPWYVYNSPEGYSVDVRWNFDWSDSFAGFVGKSFGEKVVVTPYIGGITGDYDGVSTQINLFTSSNNFSFFTLNQYTVGRGDGNPDWAYHWADFHWSLNDRWGIGIDEQIYKEEGFDPAIDVGPVVSYKLPEWAMYVKVWPAVNVDTGKVKTFVGIGHNW